MEREAITIVEVARKNCGRSMHFSVLIEGNEEPPFEVGWRYKNVRGITFARDDLAAAKRWVKHALLAGYSVWWARRKRSGGWF